jgi:hypothetical protein
MTPLCMKIMNGYAATFWLKRTLASALERDPVDALADAEVLARALREHCDNVLQRTMIEAVSPDRMVLQHELLRSGDEMG